MDLVALRKAVALPKQWIAVLAAYAAVVAATVPRHEPWFDEAQSWLLGRDLTLPKLIGWIRYEGTPPLWQIILWGANRLHLPYAALGWISGAIAVAGMFVFLRFAPFPWPVKLLLPFSYFFLYQYAVVARSYVLLPLLAFSAAALYKDAARRPFLFFAVLFLLANVSAHGTLLSAGIAAAFVVETLGRWSSLDAAARRRHGEAVGLYGLAMLGIVWMVWPAVDCTFPVMPQGWDGAAGAMAGGLVDNLTLSALVLIVAVAWCLYRRAVGGLLIPLVLLLVFFEKVYVNVWHYGAITICLITGLWIAWSAGDSVAGDSVAGKRRRDAVANGIMAVVLALVLGVQIPWSVKTIRYDWAAPYSGARNAAMYLKAVGANEQRVFAFGFSSVAILPYFDHQIFENQRMPGGTTFWQWRRDNRIDMGVNLVGAEKPDYIVFSVKEPHTVAPSISQAAQEKFGRMGYVLVHVSPGALYWKDRTWETDSYLIFAR